MASHKYVKRTGSPGDYKYWYKLPDGRIVSQDDAAAAHGTTSEEMNAHGKKDHARRLIISKLKGHHAMSHEQMASEVGITTKRLREHVSNLRQKGRRVNPSAEEHALHGHDYEEHHLHEGHKDISHPDYETHVRAHKESTEGSSPSRRGGSRPRAARPAPAASEAATPARSEAPAAVASPASNIGTAEERSALRAGGFQVAGRNHDTGYTKHVTGGVVSVTKEGDKWAVHGTDQMPKTLRTLAMAIAHANQMGGKIEDAHRARVERETAETSRDAHGRTPAEATSDQAQGRAARAARRAAAEPAAPAAPAGPSPEALAAARARLARARQAEAPAEAAPETRQRAEEASRRVAARQAQEAMQSSSPASEEARELASVDPAFAASEAPIREMLEAQRLGENPYLKRAKDIFHNIAGDLKPERKQVCDHVFAAIDALKAAGQPINEANLTLKYKELSHKRIRGLSGVAEEFERGTFMTLDEVMNNHPINVEVERMKRGFAAKQFARLKPFLNAGFSSAHPSAPPPYPTYDDLKSWDEHGGTKPSWATANGRVQKAMPKEFYDSAHTGPDGKKQMPPGWLPLHLMPVWSYVAKEHHGATGESGPLAYSSTRLTPEAASQRGGNRGGRVALPNQDTGQSILERSMRKYIQMRGGPEQLVDIPHSKLAEVGLTHSDIFRSEDGADNEMFDLIKHKIIDPVGLMKAVKKEMKGQVTKSWQLVIDTERPGVNFHKSYVVQSDIHKSKIEKVRGLLREKSRS